MQASTTSAATATPASGGPRTLATLVNSLGLDSVTGASTSVIFQSPQSNNSMEASSPAEVNSYLKRFLNDDYRFRKSPDIYAFVRLLNKANSQNSSWTPEDGQLLLDTIAKGNGLLRIIGVIVWSPISVVAGRNNTTLSFQRAYIPLLMFLASDIVVKTTLNHHANALYMALVKNIEPFWVNLQSCMQSIMSRGSFKDAMAASHNEGITGLQVFLSLITILYECLSRFKNLSVEHPTITEIANALRVWVQDFIAKTRASPAAFDGTFSGMEPMARDHFIERLENKLERLIHISDREFKRAAGVRKGEKPSTHLSRASRDEGSVAQLQIMYEGPGSHRPSGPRFDNDHEDIRDISIHPTHEELLSELGPFLPANIDGAPHHLPQRTMERHLDIQFRLLREELIAPLRTAVQLVHSDLSSQSGKTKLSELQKKKGGKYRGNADTQDGVMFNVYTGVEFKFISTDRRGISIEVTCHSPPGNARSENARVREAYWDKMSGKRLMTGGLIALVWKSGASIAVEFGTVASTLTDLKNSAKSGAEFIRIRIGFFSAEFEVRVLRFLHFASSAPGNQTMLLVESPVMFESIRPFLESLRVEPESVSLGNHIIKPFDSAVDVVPPPRYARRPGFSYQLASLFPPEAGITDLKLDAQNPVSVQQARSALKQSRLDESQASAVVDALTREVALIQGPPGTGKSYTGVELLRVLLPQAKPILMIAFTNHALDHILNSVLDAKITTNIIRLGGRSSDERISRFSLEGLEIAAGKSRLNRAFSRFHRQLRDLEDEIKAFMTKLVKPNFTSHDIISHIGFTYPSHQDELLTPPLWVDALKTYEQKEQDEGWQTIGKPVSDFSMYGFWREGRDIKYLEAAWISILEKARTPTPSPPLGHSQLSENPYAALEAEDMSDEETKFCDHLSAPGTATSEATEGVPELGDRSDDDTSGDSHPLTAAEWLAQWGVEELPELPDSESDRPLVVLLAEDEVWKMSLFERQKLHKQWILEIREREQPLRLQEYSDLRNRYQEQFKQHQEARDEARRQLLLNVDIIGCTTTGAAKLTSLLRSLDPRILLVEEAGQVLEAHILGSLVPSVEHMILIGDPQQLRPNLNNYSLSMDSRTGELYRFDMSLMERLSSSGFPMSRIDVQRRMRPAISSLIRNTLYPALIDHDSVKNYPEVKGMAQNMFFLDHENAENGDQEESASKFNTYEVDMIKDLVMYLLKQGYSQDGDIAILCAYLGQLARVRDALSKEVVVLIDDRDMQELASQEDEKESEIQPDISRVRASKQVRIRTVDNYQGEEAKIVILSLVRNAGPKGGRRPTIGFLKSANRTNVALSRAKEGLYILGNAEQLRSSSSKMWQGVVNQLAEQDLLGDALPIACARHPKTISYINKPGQLRQLAPDGGCLLPCGSKLGCGHICPYKCHPDDPKHLTVVCSRPCTKLCARGHPCKKECSTPCGKCLFTIHNVELPCGHTEPSIPCHMLDDLAQVYCNVIVRMSLPHCEHSAEMACSAKPESYKCRSTCTRVLGCCGRNCKSTCGECQLMNTPPAAGPIIRNLHVQHPCSKPLYCGHMCTNPCGPNHECLTTCKQRCRQECTHTRCESFCSTPCAPCMEQCTWACPHQKCPVPCGSICARLPCDERCNKILLCGHQCASACGENCDIQKCPFCATPDERNQVADLVLQRTLAEVAAAPEDEGNVLITLPKCRHVFTMETLDGHCGISDWYTQRENGEWLDLQTPPGSQMGMQKPPGCPTCRADITSPRYGRIFKAADLHILEQNVISRMVQQLSKLQVAVSAISKDAIAAQISIDANELDISKEKPQPQRPRQKQAQETVLLATRQTPIPWMYLTPDNTNLFSTSPQISMTWKKLVSPITQAYSSIMKVASTRSAHINAWEAAYTCLFEQEMDAASMDISRAPRNPHEYALRMARMKVGQPKPRADKRYVVEAFWISVDIRFILAQLVLSWLRVVADRGNAFPIQELQNLGMFGVFVISSCRDDIRRAYEIAQASNTRRQMTISTLLQLRADLEAFCFDLELARITKTFVAERENFMQREKECETNLIRTMWMTIQDHKSVLPADGMEWIPANFANKAALIRSEWQKIKTSLNQATFYQPVSLDEKLAIVKSLGFTHTGHFYTCPNGHVYVIGECGGAMQRGRCPECGESVGGDNHTLESTNRRAGKFEQLLGESGAARSPWRWAQGR